ncbi:MAG TPA: DUF5916 domain-containing protein [Gemmatimonadaceae bacterium]
MLAITAVVAALQLAALSPKPAIRAANAPTVATAVAARSAPVIDGRDDDPVWRTAPVFSDFHEFVPHVDAAPSMRTEFRVAYDEHDLYAFVRMFDPHPDSIMHALSRRDTRGPSDQIKLIIDSYGDHRSGYEFAVNPDGVKRDYSISNDEQEDDSWNGVWDVATRVDSAGWTAEFRIPLSQLRYAPAASYTFGFGVWRDIERHIERDAWPAYSPTHNGLVSQLGQLTGITGITTARRAELTPYVVTRNVQQPRTDGRFAVSEQNTAGGDLKLGLTPNVTLDATVNPDFGQVEADPAVLNLSAFETFFQEQRPFFVEGTGLYQFQLNCYIVVDCSTNEGLFYSRRIGRSPQLRDIYGDAATPSATPIVAASKLTGRTSQGFSFGLLDAVTNRVDGPASQTVEPRTNYAVVRGLQEWRGGESGVSVIATAVNRAADTLTSPYLRTSAYTTGATFRNRFQNGNYELAGQVAGSSVTGSPAAIYLTQTNSVHYYQQPGVGLGVDSTRTSLTGDEEQVKFGKYGGGVTRFESSVVHMSPGFEVNDVGFLRRADQYNWSTWASLVFQNAHGIYQRLQFNGNHWETWNTHGNRLENDVNLNTHISLLNNWNFHLGGTASALSPSWCDRCTRGGPLVRQSRGFFPWGGFNTDSRRVISGGVFVNLRFADEGHSQGAYVSPYVHVLVSQRLQVNVGSDISRGHDASQWFGNFTDSAAAGGATHYTFARLDQRTISMNARVNYTLTPDLTFSFYGQPFVATGEYSNVRELSATPGASTYEARYQPYTAPAGTAMAFRYTQLRSNSVVRWEYRPGSTLYVVWSHGREDGASEGTVSESWVQDYRDLFRLHPDNTFLIKLAYWLNR